MSREQLMVSALWIVHTHCLEYVEQTPYLAVTSPERRCGKSRLLELIEMLSANAWPTVLPSEAVVYRKVNADMPTLLLDEVDAIFNPRSADRYEGLRALLNAGHRRGAKVPRCVGASANVVEFSTFCAKVIAGIGTLPDTIADRSIPIRLQRQTRDEKAEPFKRRDVQLAGDELRERVEAWADAHGPKIADARPRMPDELDDRAQEGCECLVSIADLSGCGRSAREALVTLYAGERLDDQESMRVRLLRDTRSVFNGHRHMSTHDLLYALAQDDEAPWASYYGRGLDARDLSTLLSHYGIKPVNVRSKASGVVKGYKRDDLHDAWERYL
jgi:hypothetical protein